MVSDVGVIIAWFVFIGALLVIVVVGVFWWITTLLKAGADINAPGENGQTPLMFAAESNENAEVITTLLKAGADGKAKDNEGKTAFDHAIGSKELMGTDAYWKLNEARY